MTGKSTGNNAEQGQSLDITGVVHGVSRLTNTSSGNPRWRVRFSDGRMFITEPDAQVSYLAFERFVGRTVNVRLNKRNRIIAVNDRAYG